MTNAELVACIRSGNNKEALKELYRPFASVRHFIKKYGGNEDEARDVFQEALLVFYKNALKPDFKLTSALGTYLFAISKYLWKDELKKKNRIASFDVKDAPDEVIDFREQEEQYRRLDEVILSLGEKCREILNRFYYRRQSMEEIANQLDYKSVDSVKTQKYKCIERARQMAAGQDVELLTGRYEE